ncbi:MAG: phosphate-starvation-inducible PsiE family protein [Acetobacteraceae bacterium]|nr:phosphate-starvation-inducible PsiE family protein [Acetobacteraceae bacterium]
MPDRAAAPEEARLKRSLRDTWRALTLYEKFEQAVILVLTAVIAVIIVSALWNLILRVALSLVLADVFDPTDPVVFQTIFGAIFTVIIALEFKRSILVVAERRFGIVQVRAVILIAMLAIVRKLIILDLSNTEPWLVLALAAAILALGAVYWLVREQDRRDREAGLAE